ncbi:MAG: hypothetical protein IPJ79_03035 [Bacteroidetes bacterium]|nr:hypothetical protein [Bacteroidota bacterium]
MIDVIFVALNNTNRINQMKKNLTTILCLFIAALNMHDANAQTRINKKYDTDDVINISTPHKKGAQTFYLLP